MYTESAMAYDQFLRHYKNYESLDQVMLMLGLIYARFQGATKKMKSFYESITL